MGACLLAVAWLGIALAGRNLIEALLDGRFLPGLGRAIRLHMTNNPEHVSIDYFADLASAAAGRALLLWTVFLGVLVAIQHRAGDVLSRFLSAEGDAVTLAVTRIVVFAILAYSVNIQAVQRLAGQPAGMVQAPTLTGWFVDFIPLSPAIAVWAARSLIAAAGLAALGAFYRVTGPLAALLAVYVFGIPQLFGKISHGMHGLVWFSMILAVSPASATLSLDRRLGFGSSPGSGRAFGLPIRMIWILFACIYFFPGFWKFVISGWDWALSENLKFKMYSAWRGSGYMPVFRVDQYPILYKLSALVSMCWEIAFPLLILAKRTRIPALILGVLFHIGIWEFMRIGPPILLFGYVAFVDWGRLAARAGYVMERSSLREGPRWPLKTVGGAVCVLVFLFGAGLLDSWPFSVYPTHAGIRGPTYQTVEMTVVYPSGREERIDIGSVSNARSQTVDFAVIGSPDVGKRDAYLRGLAETWRAGSDSDGAEIRFYRAVKLLDPDSSAAPPLQQSLILALKPDSAGIPSLRKP